MEFFGFLIDQSGSAIPNWLVKLLKSFNNPSKFQIMELLVVSCAVETGFLPYDGDGKIFRNKNAAYNFSWSSFIDRRIFDDFASCGNLLLQNEDIEMIKLKFLLEEPNSDISLSCFESGDLIVLSVNRVVPVETPVVPTRSLALSMSRYIVTNKLNPASFRNLRELSKKVKENLFLPIRDEIFTLSSCTLLYPSLSGISDDCLLSVLKYLKLKDIIRLSITCKSIRNIAYPFLLRNKSKKRSNWNRKKLLTLF